MPLKNTEARREYKRQYYLKNKEKHNKAALEHYYANQERRQTMMQENRKRWKAEGRCVACGKPMPDGAILTSNCINCIEKVAEHNRRSRGFW